MIDVDDRLVRRDLNDMFDFLENSHDVCNFELCKSVSRFCVDEKTTKK